MKKRTSVVLSLLASIGPTSAAALPAQASDPSLRFSSAHPNSAGADTRTNTSLNNEWVKVGNDSYTATVTMTGYTIKDASGHTYTFGGFRLGPRSSVTLHTGSGTDTSTNRYWGSHAYIWNNSGDTATLRTSTGTFKDSCKWGSVADNAGVTC